MISATEIAEPVKPVRNSIVPLFATTLFVSSLLMFALEPIVAKTVLPILGGTPMVWNTCVLFFQILLLAGYAYAHGVTTWLGGKRASAAYVVLLVLPFLTLPFAVGPETQPPADGNPIGWLLLVLAKSIGLPFFALAATAPILQRWFADTDHPAARDPYFLYAASNLGSLLALVAYPLVIEPMLPLRMQNQIWAAVYGAFVLAACLSVAVGWRFRAREGRSLAQSTGEREEMSPSTAAEPIGATPTWTRRAVWVALAFIPSSLMLAVTTYFSTDIAPVPLFWIAPLALYLLTFVVAFSARSASWQSVADRFMPLLVLPLVVLMIAGSGLSLSLAIPLHLAGFTMAALVCHGRLADDRPSPVHLTEFYFWIAFGGMLGGLFNTLAAPVLFSRVIEYPLVLVLALAARRGRQTESGFFWSVNDLAIPIGVGALSAGFMVWLHPGRDSAQLFIAGLGLPALLAFSQSRAPVRFAASVATMFVAGSLAANAQTPALYVSRTFFGVYRVTTDQANEYHSLFHGTTLHGMQALDPAHQNEALTYFHREGPIGQAFAGLPGDRRAARDRGRGVGRRDAGELPDTGSAVDLLRDRSGGRAHRPHRFLLYVSPIVRRRLPCRPGRRAPVVAARPAAAVRVHGPGRLQLRRDPDPPHDERSDGAVPEPAGAGRRPGVSHLEPASGAGAGPGARGPQPRPGDPAATAQRQPDDFARSAVFRVDGDGEKRGRSRIARDRQAMDHAGDSFVDAAVDRRLLEHRQRPEPQSALSTLTTKTRKHEDARRMFFSSL